MAPSGLYARLCHAFLVSFFFSFFYLSFFMISRRQIIWRSARPIFATFTSNESFLAVDDRSGLLFSMSYRIDVYEMQNDQSRIKTQLGLMLHLLLCLPIPPILSSPSLPYPSFPFLRSRLRLSPARGSLGSTVTPLVGSGADPQPKSNLVYFFVKMWHLVATILLYFLGGQQITLSHYVCFKWAYFGNTPDAAA